ncbi:MAG: ABC transporter ATP-binding protein [Roseovarius sp.]|nr:ABC transporter ATP-binding protein [Roseovarius sp.]
MQPSSNDALLRVNGLSKRFEGLLAVDNLDFEVRPGEIFGMIGPNGAGKSTTFNLISGFIPWTTGKVQICGKTMRRGKPLVASDAGLVRTFQHGSFVGGISVRDNLRLGTIVRKKTAERDAAVVEVARRLGLSEHLDETTSNLPHGLQRRVSMAIAIAAQPRLLCLDEPLTGLNDTEVATVLTVLDDYRKTQGRAILLVEHNMKAVMRICDRIPVLHHGAHLATGSPEDIRGNKAVIEAYLGESHAA